VKQRGFIHLAVLLVTLLLGLWAFNNTREIRDWWTLRFYDPPAEIANLADRSYLSNDGRRLFYASQPEINSRDDFNLNCPFIDRSLVLGCYSHDRIYVFKVEDDRLAGIEEVTAAHELLHAVYARLSSGERERLNRLTDEALKTVDNERFLKAVEGYREDDPGALPNELHSLLGSEIRSLPVELEEHYAKYFTDRLQLVALAESYEEVFTMINDRLAGLESQLTQLRQRISTTEQSLESRKAELDAEEQRLSALRQSGQIAAYNAAVGGFNAQVNGYNELIDSYKGLVADHNKLVEQYNSVALEQNQLVQSLNSKFQPIN